jgi:hypothetical protein
MKTASELFGGKTSSLFKTWEKSVGGCQSEWNEAVGNVRDFMNDKPYGFYAKKLKGMSADKIYQMLLEARRGKNPQALFNYLSLRGGQIK